MSDEQEDKRRPFAADEVVYIAQKMRENACAEGRHEWNPSDYCKWCSKYNSVKTD